MRPDIVVYSRDEKLQLIVEIQKKTNASVEWAAKTRWNLLLHAVIEPSPFFLLVSSDRVYLWVNATSLEATPPAYEIDASEILARYLQSPTLTLDSISEYSLEMIVTAWLNEVIYFKPAKNGGGVNEDWLYASGLYDAIRDGSIIIQEVQ